MASKPSEEIKSPPRVDRLNSLLKEPGQTQLSRSNAFSTGIEIVRTTVTNAVNFAVTKLNQMIESVKQRFRTLKSKVSQTFKSRESIRTFVTTQVNTLVRHANL